MRAKGIDNARKMDMVTHCGFFRANPAAHFVPKGSSTDAGYEFFRSPN
jgi:hypothetical protein